MPSNRIAGLVGGLGPESTIDYYRRILSAWQETDPASSPSLLIDSLDDDGYLRRPIESLTDDLAFSQNVIASEEEILHVLDMVQRFDPPGVGARNLQECLLIQLRKKDSENKTIQKAIQLIENHLEEFTRKHYDKLERTLNITSEELKAIIDEILKLNPKPGDSGAVAVCSLSNRPVPASEPPKCWRAHSANVS